MKGGEFLERQTITAVWKNLLHGDTLVRLLPLLPLQAGRSGDRIPVEARFSAPVQTGPEAHPASYTMGTWSFSGVERPGRGVDHPTPSSAEVKERGELYFYSPSGPSWPVLGWNLPLYLLPFFCFVSVLFLICFSFVYVLFLFNFLTSSIMFLFSSWFVSFFFFSVSLLLLLFCFSFVSVLVLSVQFWPGLTFCFL